MGGTGGLLHRDMGSDITRYFILLPVHLRMPAQKFADARDAPILRCRSPPMHVSAQRKLWRLLISPQVSSVTLHH